MNAEMQSNLLFPTTKVKAPVAGGFYVSMEALNQPYVRSMKGLYATSHK